MKYNAQFKDITGVLYTVEITTSTGNQVYNLTLGGSPFTTTMDSDNKNLYKPVKYQSATVQIITEDYNFDIYSPKAQGTKVELKQGSNVIWTGYATPNLYDQGFEEWREEVQIECIDALSTLQYLKYQTDSKSVKSFLDIVKNTLNKCNAYTTLYVTKNIFLNKDKVEPILDKLYISEENFFNEKKKKQKDEDVAWTYKEVLEEICRFLGVTAIANGNSVFLLDYDAIKARNNTYYKYDLSSNAEPTTATFNFNKTIKAEDYSSNGAKLSLDNVYNKVSIKAGFYTYQSVITDFFANASNITKDADTAIQTSENVNNGMWGEVVKSSVGETENKNMIVMIDRTYDPQSKKYIKFNAVFAKYFNNPFYKFYKYTADSLHTDITNTVTELNYTDTKTMFGSTLAKFDVRQLDNTDDYFIEWAGELYLKPTDKEKSEMLDGMLKDNDVTSVALGNYIMLLNPLTNHIPNAKTTQFPYLKTVVTDTTSLFGGQNSYLLITGKVKFHYFSDDPYPIPDDQVDIDKGRRSINIYQAYIDCQLQWGNKYWKCDWAEGKTNGEWTTTPSTFKLPYMKEFISAKDRRADNMMFKDNDINNTVNWRIGTTETGYCIPTPTDEVVAGVPVLTIYKPHDPTYSDNEGELYKNSVVFLKDFNIKAIVGDPTFSNEQETDTVYTNEINKDFVDELKEITFKICTYDNKKPNYSSVAYKDGNTMKYLDKVFNRSCYSGEIEWDPSNADGLRQEEHLIYKLVNQYSTPSVVLELTLKNNNKVYGLYGDTTINDRSFIIDTMDIDYKMNEQKLRLIEKK